MHTYLQEILEQEHVNKIICQTPARNRQIININSKSLDSVPQLIIELNSDFDIYNNMTGDGFLLSTSTNNKITSL